VKQVTTYVGVDAHKKDLFIAMLVGDRTTPVTWQVANERRAVRRLVRKLEREAPGPVRACYEAGPCGYALQRQMTTTRVAVDVARRFTAEVVWMDERPLDPSRVYPAEAHVQDGDGRDRRRGVERHNHVRPPWPPFRRGAATRRSSGSCICIASGASRANRRSRSFVGWSRRWSRRGCATWNGCRRRQAFIPHVQDGECSA
jgi:hypothetical protein